MLPRTLAFAVLRSVRVVAANPIRLAWLVPLGVSILAVAIGGQRLAFVVLPAASDAEFRLSGLRELADDQLLGGESQALEDLRGQVSEARNEVGPAARTMRWFGRFSPALSWVPVARQEVSAWSLHTERVQRNLDAAELLLPAFSQLLASYEDAQSTLLTSGAGASNERLKADARELEKTFAEGVDAVEEASRAARTFSLALEAPQVRGWARLMIELEERLLSASKVGRQASALLVELVEVADEAGPLIRQFVVDGDEPGPWESDSLEASLTSLAEHAASAGTMAKDAMALLATTGQVNRLESLLDALDQVLAALVTVSNASVASLGIVQDAASPEGGLLDAGGGLVGIFDAFDEHGDEIADAVTELEEARRVLDALASDPELASLRAGLADITRAVSDLRAGLEFVSEIAPLGRDLLGADGVRKYLVLGQSADELRATGGFVSSVWLVSFEHGALGDIAYYDSVRVDDWEQLTLYPKAPPALEEHMNAWVWLLRDISWDPDFPTTARSAADLFRLGQRQDVDGVIAINQWTLLRLVEALGAIPPPGGGETLTSRNLLSVLERGTDQHGRAYMDLVLQGVLDRLNEPLSLPTLFRLASGFQDTLRSRDMLVFSEVPGIQSVVSEFGWSGSVRQDSMDYLYVVDSNVGWSKVDRNIERNVAYVVDLGQNPRPRATLTLGYVNHSGPGSPGCEPQWLNLGTNYSGLKNACYWNFLRVYVPQGARLLASTPMPLPTYSVSAEIERSVPGTDTGSVGSSHNRIVFSGLTTLEAGQRGDIEMTYDLPASTVRREGDRLIAELLVQKQPGVRQRDVSVDFLVPPGYRLASSSVSPAQATDSRVSFAFALTEDVELVVELAKNADDSD